MINIEVPNNNNSDIIDVEIINKKKNKKEAYGKGHEAKAIKDELGDFNMFETESYKTIIKQFGKSIRYNELLGIINSINIYIQLKKNCCLPKVTRNEKRSFPLLIKYIENNRELIIPYLQYIYLCNSSFQKISLDV